MNRRPGSPDERDGGAAGLAGQLGQYAGYGITIGLSTAAFAWLGTWVDERLHTKPLFVVIGAFLGFAAAFYSMYWRLVLRERGDDGGTPGGEDG